MASKGKLLVGAHATAEASAVARDAAASATTPRVPLTANCLALGKMEHLTEEEQSSCRRPQRQRRRPMRR